MPLRTAVWKLALIQALVVGAIAVLAFGFWRLQEVSSWKRSVKERYGSFDVVPDSFLLIDMTALVAVPVLAGWLVLHLASVYLFSLGRRGGGCSTRRFFWWLWAVSCMGAVVFLLGSCSVMLAPP